MPFAYDTFTDTNNTLLQNHTSDSGHSWVRTSTGVFAKDAVIQSNQVVLVGSSSLAHALYRLEVNVPSADYYVQADCQSNNVTDTSTFVGVRGRWDATSGDNYTLQLFGGGAGSRGVQLVKNVGGTATTLAQYLFDWANNTVYTLKLEMQGSNLRGYVNGVQRVSTTDTSLTGAGRGGIRLQVLGTSATATIDNFEITLLPQTLAQTTGIQSSEAFGNSIFQVIILQSSGIQSAEVHGIAGLFTLIQQVSGIISGEVVNTPKVIVIFDQSAGIPSEFASGIAKIYNLLQQLSGIQSAESVSISVIYELFVQLSGNTGGFQVISAGNNTFVIIVGNDDSFYKL